MPVAPRHRWIERERLFDRTRRQCLHCGLWKVTRHEPAARPQHWIEWYRADGRRVPGDATPACPGPEARAGEAGTSAPVSRASASASSVPSPITD